MPRLAHGAVISLDESKSFRQAQRLLRHDFLKRVADPQIVDDILPHPNHPKRVYDALAEPFFLPLEYSFAAYRFGHSMVRAAYNFNLNFNFSGEENTFPASPELLFTFTAMSSQLGGFDTLPENWIIEWENIVDQGTGAQFDKTRLIDTKLVEPLFGLRNFKGEIATVPGEADPGHPDPGHPEPGDAASLAIRNLLRGYLLSLPTGQAVAGALGMAPLTPAERRRSMCCARRDSWTAHHSGITSWPRRPTAGDNTSGRWGAPSSRRRCSTGCVWSGDPPYPAPSAARLR